MIGGTPRPCATRSSALLVLATLVLAGCGGEDGGAETLSSSELTDEVNAACTQARERIEALDPPESEEDVAAFGREVGAATAEMYETLTGLQGGGAAQRDLDDLIDLLDRSRALAEELGEAAREGERERLEAAQAELSELDDELARISIAAGFDACAEL